MNELATTPQRMEVEHAPATTDPIDILRYAIDRSASSETVTLAMAVRRELMAEKAKKEFDEAMASFQIECPKVIKSKSVENAYKYAPFENVVMTVKECESRHGFHHKLDTVDTDPEWVIAICIVNHRGGHSETSRVKLPIGTGTRLMSKTQIYAAAQSFALRRAFCNAFGIVPVGEDTDGQFGKVMPKGPSSVAPSDSTLKDLVKELWKTLAPVRGPISNWDAANQWMWDENVIADTQSMPDMTADEIRAATLKAKAKLA